MGMGYGSNFADVIEIEDVKQLCPDEVGALEKALEKYGVDLEALAQAFRWEVPELDDLQTAVGEGAPENLDEKDRHAHEERGVEEIAQAFEDLKSAFGQATKVGKSNLTLSIGYHNAEDDGDRYDDVEGVFWAVGGLYQLTPAGKRIGNQVERKFFVTFG